MIELILSMTLWGTLGVFVLWSGLPAIDVAFYRCLIGAAIVGVILLKKREPIRINRATGIVAVAGVCLVLNWVFLFKSFQVSSITIGNMSYYLQPIMLIILGIFIYQERVSWQKWILILMALAGVVLTIDIHNFGSNNIMLGVGYALLAALLYSFLTLFMKNVTLNYYVTIFIQLMIGTIILAPFAKFQTLTMPAVSCIAIIGFVHTLLAYFLYYSAIKKTTFTQIAIMSYLDPIVAIATDVFFFNRQLNALQLVGIALTFAALYFLVMSGKRKVAPELVSSS
jgi:drug/metabolite transporter (DMT)-like permease